jgi:hypothetical protein
MMTGLRPAGVLYGPNYYLYTCRIVLWNLRFNSYLNWS